MKKTTKVPSSVVRVSLFRTPSRHEKALQLWVDRISCHEVQSHVSSRLRLLGAYQMAHVESGVARFYSPETGWLTLEPGSTFFTFPDIPYMLVYDGPVPMKLSSVVFAGKLAQTWETIGLLDRNNVVVDDPKDVALNCHYHLRTLMGRHDLVTVMERFTTIANSLLALCRRRSATAAEATHRELMGKIVDYALTHYAENLQVTELAPRFGISPTHMRRLFRRAMGISLKHFILRTRISQAKIFLTGTSLPVKEVSEQVGFNDVFHFMRTFKRLTGMSAGRFRRQFHE